jgi:glycerol kinase
MPRFVLALDQGTTSSRAILFDEQGHPAFQAQKPVTSRYPSPGWVEQDPLELLDSVVETAREVIAKAGATPSEIAAIGVTNQRETTIAWDESGRPLYPAIVWQDRRTADRCAELKPSEDSIRRITGLQLDPYFSGTKAEWLTRRLGRRDFRLGTVDSWLIWNLTNGKVHATDPTNASRTMLLDLDLGSWSEPMLETFGLAPTMLPEVRPCCGSFGETTAFGSKIPIAGVAGDQQAALFGQACFSAGMAKCTYGTGAFLLVATGSARVDSSSRLLTTLTACPDQKWALEGSVFSAGATLDWLSRLLGLPGANELERLALGGNHDRATLVPAFTGLGAPYWDSDARGALLRLTLGTKREDLARAAFESVALQCTDVLRAAEKDLKHSVATLRVDGGGSQSDLLLQMQADGLGIPVLRSKVKETTALGAAFLAGLAVGFWPHRDSIAELWRENAKFEPADDHESRTASQEIWQQSIQAVRTKR